MNTVIYISFRGGNISIMSVGAPYTVATMRN